MMKLPLFGLLLAGAGLAPVQAADAPAGWTAVGDQRLEQIRGGFDTGNGLIVSLGIERLVSINGATVASSNFSISDVTKLSAADARMASDALAQATLVQNGMGNLAQPDALSSTGALVIQNSVNDQLIRSQTTINTTVNSLSLLKGLNFEGSLRDALSNVVGPK